MILSNPQNFASITTLHFDKPSSFHTKRSSFLYLHTPFKDPCSVYSSQSVSLSLKNWNFNFWSWLLEIGLSLVPLHPSAMGGLVNLFPNPSSRNLSIPRVLICPSLPKESQKSQQSTPSVFSCRAYL